MSTPSSVTIDEIVRRTRVPIHAPRKAAPTPQKSWQRLQVGMVLESRDSILGFPAGSRWEVLEATNQGVSLGCGKDRLWWTQPKWEESFTKVRRSRKGKE